MFQAPPRGREATSWLLAGLWALFIFCAIPFARAIQRAFDEELGSGSLRWISLAIIGLAAAVVLLPLLRRIRSLPWIRIAVLVAVLLSFLYAVFKLTTTPAETTHFVEYGVLGILLFRALSHRQRDYFIYLNVALLGSLISTTDEILQWFTPGRYWDARDLAHNALAVLLVQIAIAAGFVPAYIKRSVQTSSIRWATTLIALQALLFGFCASNTPLASAIVSKEVPAIAFLLDNQQAMSEYGWRHEDPDKLRFYSRFDRSDLAFLDHERGAEVGAIIDSYQDRSAYKDFLRRYTPARDPFTHEVMVHLFRRNHYFDVLPKYRFDPAAYAFHADVAYRENQILERYYSNSMAHSSQQWTAELREALSANAHLDVRYTSEVSKNLIHRFTEREIWWIILGILLLDALLFWRWGKPQWPKRTEHRPRVRDWIPAILWTLLIYTSIPVARVIQYWIAAQFGPAAFLWATFASFAIGLILAVSYLRSRFGTLTGRQWATLFVLLALYGAGAWHLRARPEEALHLVEYGVLSLLLYRAFRHRYPDCGAYVTSLLLGSILGISDEFIQWALPGRFFDLRDVLINVLAVLLMQLGLVIGLAPELRTNPFSVRSARTAWRQLRIILLIGFVWASNSPDVWRTFYYYRPDFFAFNEVMTDYGYLHRESDGGTFKSRLTLEHLEAMDKARATEVASKMRRYGRDDNYDDFLRRYTPISDPFAHEFRVHVFRRDRYWGEANGHRDDPARFAKAATIAFNEQRILERYFGNTLRAAERNWSEARRAEMAAAARPGPYHSRVSNEIVSAFTQAQAQWTFAVLVLVSIGVGRYDVNRRKRRDRM